MSEGTKINALQEKPDKDDDVKTRKYMEPNKYFNLDWVGSENPVHVREIIAVNTYLFHSNNMSNNKYDTLKLDDNYQSD